MRVLAVLYCYPPLLVPASMCYAKLVMGLRAAGVDVEIMTISPESFASPGPTPLDHALAARMPGDVVAHVSHSPETASWMRWIKRLDPKRHLSYRWLEPKKREWLIPARRQLSDRDLDRFDLLLTCGQPHANHLLGLELKARRRIPWISYFSDPWTDSPYAVFGSARIRAHHRRLEDQVLAAADCVLFTCEEMRQLLLTHHPVLTPERSGVLPHAFVGSWYGDGKPAAAEDAPLRILQTGSFYGPRTPLPLIEALCRVREKTPLEGRIRFDFYGGMDDVHVRAIRDAGLDSIFHVHGFVPYLDTLSLMGESDGLILIDAPLDSMAESVFLPSKLIDYLGSRKPILAVTPRQGATARVVTETGGIVCPLEEPGSLDEALISLLQRRSFGATPQESAIEAYDHRRVGADLASIMERTLAAQGSFPAGAGDVDSVGALH